MKPIYMIVLLLLSLTLLESLIGIMLTRNNILRLRSARQYTKMSALFVLLAVITLTGYHWPGLQLQIMEYWLLIVLSMLISALMVWGALAMQFNSFINRQNFVDSEIISMLFTDSELLAMEND